MATPKGKVRARTKPTPPAAPTPTPATPPTPPETPREEFMRKSMPNLANAMNKIHNAPPPPPTSPPASSAPPPSATAPRKNRCGEAYSVLRPGAIVMNIEGTEGARDNLGIMIRFQRGSDPDVADERVLVLDGAGRLTEWETSNVESAEPGTIIDSLGEVIRRQLIASHEYGGLFQTSTDAAPIAQDAKGVNVVEHGSKSCDPEPLDLVDAMTRINFLQQLALGLLRGGDTPVVRYAGRDVQIEEPLLGNWLGDSLSKTEEIIADLMRHAAMLISTNDVAEMRGRPRNTGPIAPETESETEHFRASVKDDHYVSPDLYEAARPRRGMMVLVTPAAGAKEYNAIISAVLAEGRQFEVVNDAGEKNLVRRSEIMVPQKGTTPDVTCPQ